MALQELNVYFVPFFKGKVLILRRKEGFWEFPGGSVDFGEHPKDSAIREMEEETGLRSSSEVKLLTITSAVFDKKGIEKHAVYIVYSGKVDSDQVILSGEHEDFRWVYPYELRKYPLGLNVEPIVDFLMEKGTKEKKEIPKNRKDLRKIFNRKKRKKR